MDPPAGLPFEAVSIVYQAVVFAVYLKCAPVISGDPCYYGSFSVREFGALSAGGGVRDGEGGRGADTGPWLPVIFSVTQCTTRSALAVLYPSLDYVSSLGFLSV